VTKTTEVALATFFRDEFELPFAEYVRERHAGTKR
jgi:hypothetical protein